MDPIYLAYVSLRRFDYKTVVAQANTLLRGNPADQYALLLRTQAIIEDSYFDETEFEQGALDEVIDQKYLSDAVPDLSLPTSIRPGSRLSTGYIRPLTAALGRPQTRTSSRIGSARIQTARLRTGNLTAHFSRMGTAGVQKTSTEATGTLEQLGDAYGGRPIFRRLLPNYFLRLVSSSLACDIATPNPKVALGYLRHYGTPDWFYNDRAGRAYYLLRQYRECERHMLAAYRILPRQGSYLKYLNARLLAQGRNDRQSVLELYDTASQQFGSSIHFKLQAARLGQLLRQPDVALRYFTSVLKQDRTNIEALAGAAALLEDGTGLYQKIQLQMPGDPAVWNNLGVCKIQDCLYGDAFQLLLTALGRARVGSVYSTERLRIMRGTVVYNLGCLFSRIGDLQAGRDCFELALFLDPGCADAQNNLGVLSHITGQTRKAARLFQRAIDIDPANETALRNRRVLALHRGDIETAMQNGGQAALEDVIDDLI